MAKKGFYPWIKSIFGKKDPEPVECVYAGPVKKPVERPAPEGVYAGPEYFENRGPFTGKVYAGPVPPKDEQPVMEDVYAGPEFFERDPDCTEETPEEDAPLPPDEIERLEKEDKELEEKLFAQSAPVPPEPVQMPVYAGPQFFDPRSITMMVYAGPEFFNHPENPVMNGAPAPAPMPETKPDDTPVPEGMVRCPACKAVIRKGSPFCSECGMPIKTEE